MLKSRVILGAGAIGVEFASFLNAFGCEVALVELLPRILLLEDAEISNALKRSFQRSDIECHCRVRVEDFRATEEGVEVDLL